jgi:hypothetical protein
MKKTESEVYAVDSDPSDICAGKLKHSHAIFDIALNAPKPLFCDPGNANLIEHPMPSRDHSCPRCLSIFREQTSDSLPLAAALLGRPSFADLPETMPPRTVRFQAGCRLPATESKVELRAGMLGRDGDRVVFWRGVYHDPCDQVSGGLEVTL